MDEKEIQSYNLGVIEAQELPRIATFHPFFSTIALPVSLQLYFKLASGRTRLNLVRLPMRHSCLCFIDLLF